MIGVAGQDGLTGIGHRFANNSEDVRRNLNLSRQAHLEPSPGDHGLPPIPSPADDGLTVGASKPSCNRSAPSVHVSDKEF